MTGPVGTGRKTTDLTDPGWATGEVQFKTPGGLVMVVRDDKGTVNWYSLAIDFRC